MGPGTDTRRDTPRDPASHPLLTLAGVTVAIASGVVSMIYTYTSNEAARNNEARQARDTIVAEVIQMAEYHQAREDGFSDAIQLLANDSETLILEFGHDRLLLPPTLYRQIAEYVAFSTSDTQLAQRMARHAIAESPPEGVEVVRAQRILGSIYAQGGDPEGMRDAFGEAQRVAAVILEEEPHLGRRLAQQTAAFRLLGAYLGADRAADDELKAQFCDDAEEWQEDMDAIRRQWHSSLVALQVSRIIGPAKEYTELRTICEAPEV